MFIFCYIVDYYIYKTLKESKTEEKKRRYSAKTAFIFQISQSIDVFFRENILFLQ